jgi:hypothetical protein
VSVLEFSWSRNGNAQACKVWKETRIEKEESGGGDGDGVPLWWSKMMMVQGLER